VFFFCTILQEKFAGAVNQYNEVIMHETLRVAVVGMVRNDTALTIPIALEHHIQQKFISYIEFYLCRATQKSALTGNPIVVRAIAPSIFHWRK